MHPRFLGPRDALDRDRLAQFFAQALPGAEVWRDSAFMGSVFVRLGFGGMPITIEAGKANARRGPRVPWMTITIPVATQGLEADWLRVFHTRAFQVPQVAEGEFVGTGGPAEMIPSIFDPAVRSALRVLALDRGLRTVEIRNGRVLMELHGWPADSTTLWFVLQTAHAIAARTSESLRAYVASGRAVDADPTLAAYRAGLQRSERLGKMLLFAMFGVLVPGMMLTTALTTWLTK